MSAIKGLSGSHIGRLDYVLLLFGMLGKIIENMREAYKFKIGGAYLFPSFTPIPTGLWNSLVKFMVLFALSFLVQKVDVCQVARYEYHCASCTLIENPFSVRISSPL